jgi:hypothetical protein
MPGLSHFYIYNLIFFHFERILFRWSIVKTNHRVDHRLCQTFSRFCFGGETTGYRIYMHNLLFIVHVYATKVK